MRKINIHVEGQGEIRFFSILIESFLGFKFKPEGSKNLNMSCKQEHLTINLNPYDTESKEGGIDGKKIRRLIKHIKATSIPIRDKNILIIDADTPDHKPAGGCRERKAYLANLKKEFNIEFEYFIIPDDENNGNLEDVLDKIISKKGGAFYNCLKQYTDGLSSLEGDNIPVGIIGEDLTKKRFEWYTLMMLGKHGRTETSLSKRDYLKKDLWDLDSPSLVDLVNFLKKNIA